MAPNGLYKLMNLLYVQAAAFYLLQFWHFTLQLHQHFAQVV